MHYAFDQSSNSENTGSEPDYNSIIMMYGSVITDRALVHNTNIPVMTRKDGSTWEQNRSFVSPLDAEAVSMIYGPPYARIETEEVWGYSDYWETGERWEYRHNNYLVFYEDRGFTAAQPPQLQPAG